MYSYFEGKLTNVLPSQIVYEVGGIGYLINVANAYSYDPLIDRVYIYQHVREAEISLYGFKSSDEKSMFLDLISVTGIGPKTALAILAASEPMFIRSAIASEDTTYLQKFPKIGKKAAGQIIIDLGGKYDKLEATAFDNKQKVVADNNSDVIEALMALGYGEKEVKKHLNSVDSDLTTENKIKQILSKMIK
ncbi:Holliday junction branch migration protein RuvA [Mollicutes bacterium LVI A0039]|nr:Holliday junction branch migration protein RuvA [Mollicutes bacterium LVI A0039]